MPARKITVPVTPDMQKTLDELCELHALQLPSLASMLLRDALAGRRSALLPKRAAPARAQGSKVGSALVVEAGRGEESGSGGAWGLLRRSPHESAAGEAQE